MPGRTTNLMDPPIEELLDKVDSKFTLVVLAAKRARQVNSYFGHLGEGGYNFPPPQVPSLSAKPLTIAFGEIAAGKATFVRKEPGSEQSASEAMGADGLGPRGDVSISGVAGEADIEGLEGVEDLDGGAGLEDSEGLGEAEPGVEPGA
jgi:DNA-directed RNA polymerase omega subunit